jgi:hypothetical protein
MDFFEDQSKSCEYYDFSAHLSAKAAEKNKATSQKS